MRRSRNFALSGCVAAFLVFSAGILCESARAQTAPPAASAPWPDEARFPADPAALTAPVPYETLAAFLAEIGRKPHIQVTEELKTPGGRSLFLVHANRGGEAARWRVFFIGQQHGDEPAGKDALLYLLRDIAERPDRLPRDVDLWVAPQANPDGAAANRRRNANGADLNRDHTLLSQPETRALHAIVRRLRPHVTVDCHEFGRDSAEYFDRGWLEWPLIMMDTANHPLYPAGLYEAGLRWVEAARPVMAGAGYNYTRYFVGGAPPEDELRPSTLEPDDARNGLGAYGGLSFIIESGVWRRAENPNANLPERVGAYLVLLRRFLDDASSRDADLELIETARLAPMARFLPVNCFWGSAGLRPVRIPIIERATGKTLQIETASWMGERVVKGAVPAPRAYAIAPAAAPAFRALLERHALRCETVSSTTTLRAEICRLVRIEDEEDPVYHRYAGRQIVRREAAREMEFAPGTLLVTLSGPGALEPLDARRAALLLEPCQIYGLYQFDEFRPFASPGAPLPAARILSPAPAAP